MDTIEASETELGKLRERIAELEKANTFLEESFSEKKFASSGRMARNFAHEIRNPLTNINLAVEQLVADLPHEENTRFLLDMINRNSKRINQIISELLTSTRFADMSLSAVWVNDMLREVAAALSDKISMQKIELQTSLDPAVKDIRADKGQLIQAFEFLLTNSIEALENKDNALLQLTTALKDDDVIVTITDNGKGLSEEDAKKLFEPYFSKKQLGLGLSLTTVQNIVLNHKGSINFNTRLGEGTSFVIRLNSFL